MITDFLGTDLSIALRMARRSLRVSDAAAPRSSSKRPTASEDAEGPSTKRTKVQQVAVRSKISSPEETEQSGESEPEEASGYEDSSEDEVSEDEPEDEYASSEDEPKPKRKTNGAVKRSPGTVRSYATKNDKKTNLAKPGTKTGLGPGTQVVIKKPRARSPGATPYTDETIHPNTMLFLKDLAANNDRAWLKMHDPDYRASWKDFETFLDAL